MSGFLQRMDLPFFQQLLALFRPIPKGKFGARTCRWAWVRETPRGVITPVCRREWIMKHNKNIKRLGTAVLIGCGLSFVANGQSSPQITVVSFGPPGQSYVSLLKGPPQTRSLHSGLVTLAPGASVGAHTTGTNEEMLIPLGGEGELRCTGHPPIHLEPGLVTYAPPHTKHDVVNTGAAPLRYIYVTAKAE